MRVVAGVCDEESAVLLVTRVRAVVVLVAPGSEVDTGPVMTVVVLLPAGAQVEQHLRPLSGEAAVVVSVPGPQSPRVNSPGALEVHSPGLSIKPAGDCPGLV